MEGWVTLGFFFHLLLGECMTRKLPVDCLLDVFSDFFLQSANYIVKLIYSDV